MEQERKSSKKARSKRIIIGLALLLFTLLPALLYHSIKSLPPSQALAEWQLAVLANGKMLFTLSALSWFISMCLLLPVAFKVIRQFSR